MKLYRWFISHEKPMLGFMMMFLAIWGKFTIGYLFTGLPWYGFFLFTCAGGCVGTAVGVVMFFIILGLEKVGLVSPDTNS